MRKLFLRVPKKERGIIIEGMNRGQGIYSWLARYEEVTDWIVLDDEIFEDYEKYGIMGHLVKTEYSDANGGGLQLRHVEQVIEIINGSK